MWGKEVHAGRHILQTLDVTNNEKMNLRSVKIDNFKMWFSVVFFLFLSFFWNISAAFPAVNDTTLTTLWRNFRQSWFFPSSVSLLFFFECSALLVFVVHFVLSAFRNYYLWLLYMFVITLVEITILRYSFYLLLVPSPMP